MIMLGQIAHVGLTVRDMEATIAFYRDILGLSLTGDMIMEGESVALLTQIPGAKLRVVYFNSNEELHTVPIELIQFLNGSYESTSYNQLNYISVSEVCFWTDNIAAAYEKLKTKGVTFLSEPQYFDLSDQGYGKSKAVYFYDNNGIILELMELIN